MLNRLIVCSYPESNGQARIFRTLVEQDDLSPYKTVDFLLENIESLENAKTEQVVNPILIEDVLTIHNSTGMRDLAQLQTMIEKIKHNRLVINDNGLPNIKLVLAPDKHLLMFDGHHTALAYLLAGKKFLHETPYILLSNARQPLSPREISYFFPKNSRESCQ